MSAIRLVAAGVLLCWLQSAALADQTDLECLVEAIIAESTLSKESLKADKLVGHSIKMRVLDGQWGPTYCAVINTRWQKTGYRMVKVTTKTKAGKRVSRLVKKSYTYYSYDYKYKGKPYYKDIVQKSSPAQVAQAQEAAEAVYYDRFEPEAHLRETKQYMYPKYASPAGKFWFECVGVWVGKADPESVHEHYRDATEDELTKKLLETPACKRSIDIFRESRDRNQRRKQQEAAAR